MEDKFFFMKMEKTKRQREMKTTLYIKIKKKCLRVSVCATVQHVVLFNLAYIANHMVGEKHSVQSLETVHTLFLLSFHFFITLSFRFLCTIYFIYAYVLITNILYGHNNNIFVWPLV